MSSPIGYPQGDSLKAASSGSGPDNQVGQNLIDQAGGYSPVAGKSNPLTGGTELISNGRNTLRGELALKPPSFILSRSQIGTFAAAARSAGDVHTTHFEAALESGFDQVQILLPNHSAATITVKASLAVATAAGGNNSAGTIDPTLNGGAWVNCTFSGSATGTKPAYPGGGATQWLATDWMDISSLDRSDGGSLPILHGRIEDTAGTTAYTLTVATPDLTGWEQEGGDGVAPYGRLMRVRHQAVAGVTTKAAFTSTTSASQCIPFIIRYRSRTPGFNVLVFGDSIRDGLGATLYGNDSVFRAACRLSMPSRPVSVSKLAVSGSTSVLQAKRAETWSASDTTRSITSVISPHIIASHSYWSNDNPAAPLTAAEITLMRRSIGRIRAEAERSRATMMHFAAYPASSRIADGTDDALRIALSEEVRTAAIASGEMFVDSRAALSVVSGGKESYIAGMSGDSVHPSEAAHEIESSLVENQLRSVGIGA